MNLTFPDGILSLEIRKSDIAPENLFAIAHRQNPNRSFLFVCKPLGRHIPARPREMREMHKILAGKIPVFNDGLPVLFVGMAETAIALGVGVFREAGIPGSAFMASTRHEHEGEILSSFREGHCHAPEHLLYRTENLPQAAHLVIVDDEMTTGNTANNLVRALEKTGIGLKSVNILVIMNWSGREDVHSILSGAWNFKRTGSGDFFPDGTMARQRGFSSWPSKRGLDYIPEDWNVQAGRDEKILVLGTGEFAWPPFLLAEKLEKQGADVFFAATTRSPIKKGGAIRSVFVHKDNYNMGINNYLYNFDINEWDRVIICSERSGIDPDLINKTKAETMFWEK